MQSKPWMMQSLVLEETKVITTITTEKMEIMRWYSQGVMVLRDLGAQVSSRCSWINA